MSSNDMSTIQWQDRDSLARTPAHDLALECLRTGIEAAHPKKRVKEALSVTDGTLRVTTVGETSAEYDLKSYEDIFVLGGGNAAGHFASALEEVLDSYLDDGVVVTDDPTNTRCVETLAGSHPVPSKTGIESTRTLLEFADDATGDDLVIAPITGGGSALLAAPAAGLTLADLQSVTTELLACGATIDEINAVRKHCSAIKGGQLARTAAPATIVTLIISDVIRDDLSVIASGPTVPDPSTYGDALDVLERYDIEAPTAVITHLESGAAGEYPETPASNNTMFDTTNAYIIGNNRSALNAAASTAAEQGYTPTIISSSVRGEASQSALTHVAITEECLDYESPVEPPAVILSGGETTVTLTGDHGDGGPNQEFVLGAGLALEDERIVVASVDTDGIDGSTNAAGAIADAMTVPADAGYRALKTNDVFPVLDAADALLRSGPSGTNVNDLRVFVIDP